MGQVRIIADTKAFAIWSLVRIAGLKKEQFLSISVQDIRTSIYQTAE